MPTDTFTAVIQRVGWYAQYIAVDTASNSILRAGVILESHSDAQPIKSHELLLVHGLLGKWKLASFNNLAFDTATRFREVFNQDGVPLNPAMLKQIEEDLQSWGQAEANSQWKGKVYSMPYASAELARGD